VPAEELRFGGQRAGRNRVRLHEIGHHLVPQLLGVLDALDGRFNRLRILADANEVHAELLPGRLEILLPPDAGDEECAVARSRQSRRGGPQVLSVGTRRRPLQTRRIEPKAVPHLDIAKPEPLQRRAQEADVILGKLKIDGIAAVTDRDVENLQTIEWECLGHRP